MTTRRMQRISVSAVAVLTAVLAIAARADDGKHAPPMSNPTFDQLKSLVGDWEADGQGGNKLKDSISLTGGGSVLMENMMPGTDHAMVTMYHPDGKTLVATHYCAAGNQPRLRASGFEPDGKTVVFNFADATNMASPSDVHMDKVAIQMVDADHFDATWTSKGGGPHDSDPMVFHWARVKAAK